MGVDPITHRASQGREEGRSKHENLGNTSIEGDAEEENAMERCGNYSQRNRKSSRKVKSLELSIKDECCRAWSGPGVGEWDRNPTWWKEFQGCRECRS